MRLVEAKCKINEAGGRGAAEGAYRHFRRVIGRSIGEEYVARTIRGDSLRMNQIGGHWDQATGDVSVEIGAAFREFEDLLATTVRDEDIVRFVKRHPEHTSQPGVWVIWDTRNLRAPTRAVPGDLDNGVVFEICDP